MGSGGVFAPGERTIDLDFAAVLPDLTALVIDDDDFSRATAVRILARIGVATVMEASDGRAALDRVAQAGGAIDLILCDLRMPHFDGIETLGALASSSGDAMFILASSAEPRLLRAAASSAQRAGIAALRVLSKPVTLAKMAEAVSALVANRVAPLAPEAVAPDLLFTAEEIKAGLARGEFVPFYQPKVDVNSHRLCGAEALIRWHHPLHGIVGAGTFMGVVQRSGLLDEVFFTIFPQAVADWARWVKAGVDAPISINLPIAVLSSGNLPNQLDTFVQTQGLQPSHVTFEVTEDGWLLEQSLAREVLTRLRIRGFGLAIDDFGAGYSGLQQLLNAPFNELKIDQEFIRAAPNDPEAAIALANIVALARQLDLTVVAEGVETAEQCALITAAGCDQIQGFLIARPLPAADFARWLGSARECLASGSVA